jgi:hypothetical protein
MQIAVIRLLIQERQKLRTVWYRINITVAARSNTLDVFARSNAVIVGSNPNQDIDVCACVYSVCVVLCR